MSSSSNATSSTNVSSSAKSTPWRLSPGAVTTWVMAAPATSSSGNVTVSSVSSSSSTSVSNSSEAVSQQNSNTTLSATSNSSQTDGLLLDGWPFNNSMTSNTTRSDPATALPGTTEMKTSTVVTSVLVSSDGMSYWQFRTIAVSAPIRSTSPGAAIAAAVAGSIAIAGLVIALLLCLYYRRPRSKWARVMRRTCCCDACLPPPVEEKGDEKPVIEQKKTKPALFVDTAAANRVEEQGEQSALAPEPSPMVLEANAARAQIKRHCRAASSVSLRGALHDGLLQPEEARDPPQGRPRSRLARRPTLERLLETAEPNSADSEDQKEV